MTATPRTKIAEIMIMTAQRADKSISSAPLDQSIIFRTRRKKFRHSLSRDKFIDSGFGPNLSLCNANL